MTKARTLDAGLLADSTPRLAGLHARIGWLCQLLRVAAIAYAVWTLATIIYFWSDQALVVEQFGRLGVDASDVGPLQRLAAFAVSFVIWQFLAAACYSGWRLFSSYLSGSVFTADAAIWLRRLALFGLVAALVDIAARPLISLILTAHKPAGAHVVSVYFRTEDLSTVLLLATLLALAHIQKTATDIADENEQFV